MQRLNRCSVQQAIRVDAARSAADSTAYHSCSTAIEGRSTMARACAKDQRHGGLTRNLTAPTGRAAPATYFFTRRMKPNSSPVFRGVSALRFWTCVERDVVPVTASARWRGGSTPSTRLVDFHTVLDLPPRLGQRAVQVRFGSLRRARDEAGLGVLELPFQRELLCLLRRGGLRGRRHVLAGRFRFAELRDGLVEVARPRRLLGRRRRGRRRRLLAVPLGRLRGFWL